MNHYTYLYLLAISFCFSNSIIHEKLDSSPYGTTIPIKAFLSLPESKVHRFTLLYRSKGNMKFIESKMKMMGRNLYISEIPGSFVIREEIEYYLLLELQNGSSEYFPEKYNDKKFISVNIENKFKESISSEKFNEFNIHGLEPEVTIISPKPGEEVLKNDLFIALSYFKVKNIDISNIKIFLDDEDVKSKSNIDSSYLSISSESINPGKHTIKVNLANTYGQKFKDIIWSFTVLPGKQINNSNYSNAKSNIHFNHIAARAEDKLLSYGKFNYSYEIDFDWLSLDLSILKSSLENEYDQSRDRYKIKLKNDYMDVQLGDSYPNIDQFSWRGHHLRGINLIFETDRFYLNIVNGRTKRAVQGNPLQNSMFISSVDSSESFSESFWNLNISRSNYSFEQKAFAVKLMLPLKKNILWDINYIKIRDNIESVSSYINNAEIEIPSYLVGNIKSGSEEYFSDKINNKIKYNILIENYQNILDSIGNISTLEKFWHGEKPIDNYILGSNIKFTFDESKINLNSGFSLSLFNGNKWNDVESISEFDTFAYDDNNEDEYFYNTIEIDTSFDINQYKNTFNFSRSGQPLIPFILQKDKLSFSKFMKLPNLNKYTNLKLLYLGHTIELGSKQNGPDYYSILNPFINNNYKENYFSDQFNLFQNKLLFYYKKSLIKENLYDENKIPLKTKKDLFNLSLYPGEGLPSFNFYFSTFYKSNGLKNINSIEDSTYNQDNLTSNIILDIETITLDNRIDLSAKQMNLSMTNQFNFYGSQYLTFHYYNFEQEDLRINTDLLLENFIPNDASSSSHGFSIKSIYNKYWESSLYLNSNIYEYGSSNYDDYVKQKLIEYRFKLVQYSTGLINNLRYGVNYSVGRGNKYLTQYNFNFGINLVPFRKFNINCYIDYRMKYLGFEGAEKSNNDFFFKTNIYYDIR